MDGLRALLSLVVAFAALAAAAPARAGDCPGRPGALGTSRTITIDPTEHIRLGAMQYPETLPLADREVVLTFDDGPLAPYTTRALEILESECVKATFFLVGRMAKANPALVRRIQAAGHTIGTHSNSHPFTFHRMTTEQAHAEVEGGIEAIAAALGDRNAVAPFFRIPGLMRGETIERYLAGRSLMAWSADFPGDDWLRIPASEIAARSLRRIEARGRGMLLLHEIKPATVLALPVILQELKKRGYRIVHVEPAGPDRPKTATAAADWSVRKGRNWPAPMLTMELLLAEPALPAPDPASFGVGTVVEPGLSVAAPRLQGHGLKHGEIPLPPVSPWPRLSAAPDPLPRLAAADTAAPPAALDTMINDDEPALPAPDVDGVAYRHDFAGPALGQKALGLTGFPPALPSPRKVARPQSASNDVTGSARPPVPRREVETAGIFRFLFPPKPPGAM